MFYCESCRKSKNWPEGHGGSHGRCEVCGLTADCHDVPSKHLPIPPRPKQPVQLTLVKQLETLSEKWDAERQEFEAEASVCIAAGPSKVMEFAGFRTEAYVLEHRVNELNELIKKHKT